MTSIFRLPREPKRGEYDCPLCGQEGVNMNCLLCKGGGFARHPRTEAEAVPCPCKGATAPESVFCCQLCRGSGLLCHRVYDDD